jgi:protein O-GlcNAc transferase
MCSLTREALQAHADLLNEGALPRRADCGLPDDKIIFSCSNQLYKYDPATFATWMRILQRVPDSVLWLLRFPAAGEPRVYAEAAAHGVHESRIIFTAVAQKNVHIARSGLADVFLDTPLCNAHTTGCDVLWGGAPVVTLPLERMASRVCASLCVATGHGADMVVASQAEYEERAVEFGVDARKRGALRARLEAARLTCPLFDTQRWVRNLERVFARLWAIHAAGEAPHWFQVSEDDPLPGDAAPAALHPAADEVAKGAPAAAAGAGKGDSSSAAAAGGSGGGAGGHAGEGSTTPDEGATSWRPASGTVSGQSW